MALNPLATAADLSVRQYDITDTGRVDAALAAASESVRDAAGCAISQVTSTITLWGTPSPWLDLPGGPVTAVASVVSTDVDTSGWRLVGRSLWLACGWGACGPSEITVTYTHGFVDVPADIVDLVCELAGASLLVEGAHDPRVASEAIDDSRTGWQQGADATTSVFELPERTRAMLARRFGGGVYVTGSR